MRIVVLGTIVADTIEHLDGGVTESLGGIAHTVATLSALGGERHVIVPVCRVGEDCRERVTAWASGLPGVSLAAVRWMPEANPRVRLSYPEAGRPDERVERLSGSPPPLEAGDLGALLGAGVDLALVNCITGNDCTPEALAALRAASARVYLDVHSLALGMAADGARFLRPRDDWDDWIAHADVVQSNVPEAATFCGLPGDAHEYGADEVLAALTHDLETRQVCRRDAAGAAARPDVWLLTLGSAGVAVIERHAGRVTSRRLPAPRITAVDPTGAGDAFGAGYALAWLEGASPLEAARAGVRAGTAACRVAGSPSVEAFRRGSDAGNPVFVAVSKGRSAGDIGLLAGGEARYMPVVSIFSGIVIRMFYREHGPPHFHAEHQGQRGTFAFDGRALAGAIRSGAARRLIRRWAFAHRSELESNWRRIEAGEALERIAPLD